MSNHPKLFTPREAAQVLGVSYPALKQWIYKRKIMTNTMAAYRPSISAR
jgi:predicted site-specific integrase-resolvase